MCIKNKQTKKLGFKHFLLKLSLEARTIVSEEKRYFILNVIINSNLNALCK